MTAAGVKRALYARHYASSAQMPGPWTCIEEWRNIDLLAFSAWSSASGGRYDRIGYEVKVSRSDLRAELLNPYKRARNVEWCNEFYLAVPKGMLTADELAWQEPEWPEGAFSREQCPNRRSGYVHRGRKCQEAVPVPTTCARWISSYGNGYDEGYVKIPCRQCGGRGYLERSHVETVAPTVWVPRDLGLITVDGRGTRMVKRAPRRKEVPAMSAGEVGQLVRFVSMRPDPRHAPRRNRHIESTPLDSEQPVWPVLA